MTFARPQPNLYQPLTAILKLSTEFGTGSRIWTKMYKLTCGEGVEKPDRLPHQDDAHLVTFPSPFKEFRGKHGRGLGLNYDPDLKYLTQIIYEINNELSKYGINLFDIKPPPEAPDNPNDPRTIIARAIFITDPKRFLTEAGFTAMEVDTLKDLGNSLKRLTSSQVQCLGTHDHLREAIYDIDKEYRDLEPHRKTVVKKLRDDQDIHDDLYKMRGYVEEAWLKSLKNQDDYKNAYIVLSRELRGNIALNTAFQESQSQPEAIWGTPQVRALASKSQKAWALIRYLCAIDYLKGHVAMRTLTPTSQKFHENWENILEDMARSGFTGFTRSIPDIFVGSTSKINPSTRDYLINQLDALPTW